MKTPRTSGTRGFGLREDTPDLEHRRIGLHEKHPRTQSTGGSASMKTPQNPEHPGLGLHENTPDPEHRMFASLKHPRPSVAA